MKPLIILLSVLASLLSGCSRRNDTALPLSQIEYQGITIATARSYADLTDFKNDGPGHLSVEAAGIAAQAVRSAAFGPHFQNHASLDEAFDRLRFPGYGSFYANQIGANIDPVLELMYVEVPQQGQNRYLAVARSTDGTLKVVADFVGTATPEIVRVRRNGAGELEFMSKDGATVVTRNAA